MNAGAFKLVTLPAQVNFSLNQCFSLPVKLIFPVIHEVHLHGGGFKGSMVLQWYFKSTTFFLKTEK
jgi:hypothetical protein